MEASAGGAELRLAPLRPQRGCRGVKAQAEVSAATGKDLVKSMGRVEESAGLPNGLDGGE